VLDDRLLSSTRSEVPHDDRDRLRRQRDLLDLRALDTYFELLFGSAALRAQWFAQMLQLSFVGGLTGQYVDFTTAQRAALQMLGERQGVALDDATVAEIGDRMRRLPPHPEVAEALRTLAGTSLRLVALTNSTAEVAHAQLTHAGPCVGRGRRARRRRPGRVRCAPGDGPLSARRRT
jgi:hypothetical protein